MEDIVFRGHSHGNVIKSGGLGSTKHTVSRGPAWSQSMLLFISY